jgi:hypothetical protein
MKKSLHSIAVMASLCVVLGAVAQPIPHRQSDGVQFVNGSGRAVFTNLFDDAQPFSDGVAVVRRGKLWGAVDLSGNVLCRSNTEALDRFQIEERAHIKGNGE